MKNICLAGGVGLNCVANWRILQESGFDKIFIQPAAGDSGGALGVAFYIANTVLKTPRVFTMDHALWGPGFSDDEILATLTKVGAAHEYVDREEDLLDHRQDARRRQGGGLVPRAAGVRPSGVGGTLLTGGPAQQ
ncbi:MAG: hypothetical protein IID33_11155 [Planctomycetes bacterium]|nr:hypothetical protein [Planctomycetota bacterium]